MRFSEYVLILIALMTLASCARFTNSTNILTNRDKAYLKAQALPPLKIPPGIDSSSIHEEYPVPEAHYSQSATNVSLVPPDL